MKSVKGKKFCRICKENVYDVRRKSVDSIIELKKKLGSCCVIISNTQLEEYDRRVHGINKTEKRLSLKMVAGIAAISVFPAAIIAQGHKVSGIIRQFNIVRTKEGIVTQQKIQQDQPQKEVVMEGKFLKTTYGYPPEGMIVTIGYYTNDSLMGNLFYPYKEFETRRKGKFKISLTATEYDMLKEHSVSFISEYYMIEMIECDLVDPSKKIVLRSKRKPSHADGRLLD